MIPSFSYDPAWLPASAWAYLTRFGESTLLVPLAVLAACWLARHGRDRRLAISWMLSLAAGVAITAGSKLAFMGWGIGHAGWDFTGFSGHAMSAAAVLPLLAWAALPKLRAAIWVGLALSVIVAWSRVQVGAHSVSEALLGWLLGAAVTAVAVAVSGAAAAAPLLLRQPATAGRAPAWLPAAVIIAAVFLPAVAPPSPTHDWVTELSLKISGRSHPYTREDLRREARSASTA